MTTLEHGIYNVQYENLEVPAVVLGGGNVNIFDLTNRDNGFFGVGFAPIEPNTIGHQVFGKDGEPTPLFDETDCKFHIISNNVDSLDVLIRRLMDVRNELMVFQEEQKCL